MLPPDVVDIGGAVRNARRRRGLLRSELGKLARVSQSYLCEIEAGDTVPSVPRLQAIAAALGVKLSRIIKEAEIIGGKAEG